MTRSLYKFCPDSAGGGETLAAVGIGCRYAGVADFAIDEPTLELRSGEVVGVVGLAGSGKTTLGRLFKGLMEPDEGAFVRQMEGASDSPAASSVPVAAAERLRLVGWTEAHPERQFFADSVRDEIAFGLTNQGLKGDALDARIRAALETVGMNPDDFVARHPRALSGGEKRRIALASVAAMDFRYYIFDEPTAGLDASGCAAVVKLILNLKEQGRGIMWLTHDIESLPGVIDRLCGLSRGKLVFDAPAARIGWDALREAMSQGVLPQMEF